MDLHKRIALLINVLGVLHQWYYAQAGTFQRLLEPFYPDNELNEALYPFMADESICPDPSTPENGEMYCGLSKKLIDKYVCKAKCKSGYEFYNNTKRGKLICDINTSVWSPKAIFPDCQKEIKCDPPCTNGGKCEGENICTCPPRYSGDECDVDNCATPEAPSNGNITCIKSASNSKSYTCEAVCNPGFEFPDKTTKETYSCDLDKGTWSINFNDRSSVCQRICTPPCQNGGVCVEGNRCVCTSQYRGDRCDIESCRKLPVPKNGKKVSCNDLLSDIDSYMCIAECSTGYQFPDQKTKKSHTCSYSTGKWLPNQEFPDCERICFPPCQNGGKCIGGDRCDCLENFTGVRCQTHVNPTPSLVFCPEIPESIQRNCPQSCPDGSACDGTTCVSIESCPCFQNRNYFEPGSEIKTRDCQRCTCLSGGHSSCNPIKCSDCPSGQLSVLNSVCQCTCTECPAGTKLCPTDGKCVKEELWCNRVNDCADDELNCKTFPCSTDYVPDTNTCDISGNAIETFDGISFQYDVCNHVLMKESESEKYSVTVHKICPSGSLESCYQELVINVDGTIIKFGPGMDFINYKDIKVGTEKLWLVSERATDFKLKQIGNSIFFKSLKYHFDVTWNKAEVAKITVSKCLVNKIAGLCGFYNRQNKDEFTMPNGRIASKAPEFGNSWATGSLDLCKPPNYPNEIKKIADKSCSKLNEEPFNSSCFQHFNMDHRKNDCINFMQECLQRSDEARILTKNGKTPSFIEINKCKCQAFESFVEACEIAKNGPIKEWRMQHDCSPTCPEGMVWMDCGPGCNLTCDNYRKQATLCSSKCVPGCYCPSGLVLQKNQCVKPKMCFDCVCRGHGDPNYVTFDGRYYAFQGTCTYILVQHETSEDFTRNFKVLATNVECPDEPHTSCIESLTILWNGHTIEKQKNKQVILDKKPLGPEHKTFDQDGIYITYEPNKNTVMHIKEINLVVRYFDLVYGYTIEIPSFFYFNKTEGLCGICNFIESDDLYHRDGYLATDIEEFAYSWLEGRKTRKDCEFTRREISPPPPPGLCNFTDNPCEILLDPSLYIKSCLNDVQHSQTPKSSMCRSKYQYAQVCCERGVSLTEWLKSSGCESSCPDGLEYKCASACSKTCENYKTFKEDTCDLTPMFSCMCPEGEVTKNGTCVKTVECETCDSEGHTIGSEWPKGPCETCKCLPDLTISCTVVQCAGPPVCKSTEQIQKLPHQEGSCCETFKCVLNTTFNNCKDLKLENCPPGSSNVVVNSGDCPVYRCKCFPHLCPPTVIPFLEEGENYTIVTGDCCPEIKPTCSPKLCPLPPTCNQGFKLSVQAGRCCNKSECVFQDKVCVYRHKYRVESGKEVELPLEGYHEVEYEPGSSWQDGLCQKCSCFENNGQLGYSCAEKACPDPKDSPDAKKYVMEGEEVPGSCCLKYKRTRCISNRVERRIGEKWITAEGEHCLKINSCNSDKNGEAVLHTSFTCQIDCRKKREISKTYLLEKLKTEK